MISPLKIRRIEDSLGVILPEAALEAMNVREGDTIYLTETADSEWRMTAQNPGFDEAMKIADSLIDRYSNALKTLS